ncbi:MAG: hypothetical protein U0547_09445 [Dehalococcoidia bacterium]
MGGAKELNQALAERIKHVQLIGEIQLTDDEFKQAVQEIRDLVRRRQDPGDYPSMLAAVITEIAARQSDGITLWPHVADALALNEDQEKELGSWYVKYLRSKQLPDFEYLVRSESAMRYRTRVLAHALVPRLLVPRLMEYVLWPAVTTPEGAGSTGDEIQQNLARRPADERMPRSLRRFIVYGGPAARDVLDRCLAFARHIAEQRADSGYGLPPWLRDAIKEWVLARPVAERAPAVLREAARRRYKVPALTFDPGLWRVVLELPHQDPAVGPLTWRVNAPGVRPAQYPATLPLWQRLGTKTEHELTGSFAALQVDLVTPDGGTAAAWSLPALSVARPALFFSTATLRARSGGGFLEGDDWYLLRDAAAPISTDGELVSIQPPRELHGAWGRVVAECVGVEGGSWLRVGDSEFELVREPARARLSAPGIPDYLAPVEEGVLAFEDQLPEVLIPGTDGDDSLLRNWQIAVRNVTGEQAARSPRELGAVFDPEQKHWRVPLQELIPREDVGRWELEVAGPLGQGFQSTLHLLPRMTLEVPREVAIAGAAAAPRAVMVEVDASLEVLEQKDRAERDGTLWVLEDRNRNGRIPFNVRDPRSGREVSAVVVLPTVRWRWRGNAQRDYQKKLTRPVKELLRGDWTLEVEAPRGARLSLTLWESGARAPSQQEEIARTSPARVSPARFADTLAASTAALFQFRLELARSGTEPVRSLVAATFKPPRVSGLTPRLEGDELIFTWHQEHVRENLTIRLDSQWAPWEQIEPAPAVRVGDRWEARFPGMSEWPGRFRFAIWSEDDWLGSAQLYTRGLTIGDGDLDQYLRSLPHSVEGLLERALAQPNQSKAMEDVARLASDPVHARRLVEIFCTVLSKELPDTWTEASWHAVGDALGKADIDVTPLLAALVEAPRSERLLTFVRMLGIPRWRSAWRVRAHVSDALRTGLWSLWPPLGAAFDFSLDEERARDRCRDYLGVAAGDIPVKDHGSIAGHLSSLSGPGDALFRQHTEPDAMLLTNGGWEACKALTFNSLQGGGGPARALAGDLLSIVDALRGPYDDANEAIKPKLRYDFCAVRTFPGARTGYGLFPAMSLAWALEDRLVARGILPPTRVRAPLLELRGAFPELHAHDLCLAELIVASRFRS